MSQGKSPMKDLLAAVPFVVGIVASAWGTQLAFHVAPIERTLKFSQKIFYWHAPIGMAAIIVTLIGAGAAVTYLINRRLGADRVAEACLEVAMLATAVSLITGCIWAKPAWGDYFPLGEPRVTGMFVLLLILACYFAVRSSVEEPLRRARISGVMAIIGAINGLVAYFAIHIWNTTHPTVFTAREARLEETMLRAFLWCLVGTVCLTVVLIRQRLRYARLRDDLESCEQLLMEREA
ncbi:MAG: cytochrome c biogenesis protein [Acidobacteriota bacterium]